MDVTNRMPTPEQALALKKSREIDEAALRTIFLEARTANGFLDAPVPHDLLLRVAEVAELGPTSANSLPARFVFVTSPEGKERLRPALGEGNVDKTMKAPAVAIVAADLRFFEKFGQTFPTRPEMADGFRAAYEKGETWVRDFARDNALLQMGYFIVSARAFGLDCGPMGGFDRQKVDAAFFPDGRLLSLYLINLGYGDDSKGFPRLPRLPPAEIATFV